MLIIDKDYTFDNLYPLKRIAPSARKPLFFDIETTGLSARSANIYLIGCIYPTSEDCSNWHMRQFFAQTPDEEPELLERFSVFLKQFDHLIHFNGMHFDVPFVCRRSEKFNIETSLALMPGTDLYQRIKPYRDILGLPNCRQKTFEALLGIIREDTYDGGALIEVYHHYTQNRSSTLLHLLLLHNEEDCLGMPKLMNVMHYPDFLFSDFSLGSSRDNYYSDLQGSPHHELFLKYSSSVSIPAPFTAFHGTPKAVSDADSALFNLTVCLKAEQNSLLLRVPVQELELKYFIPDYQNYYYLPVENRIVHKSVGAYVDKEHRVKATARSCFIPKTAQFVPVPGGFCPENTYLFRENFNDKQLFAEAEILKKPELAVAYLQSLIEEMT